jgi:two-component system sensor histidine kinase UhpB
VRLSDGSIIGIGQDISRRKRVERERESLFRQVEVSREQLVSLSRRLVEVQEAERRDLAGRLHDDVGQDLTALSLNLNIVRDMVRGKLPAAVRAALATRMDDSVNLVDKTVDHIRDVMAELRPPMLDDYGLTAALHWYGKEFSERTGIATGLQLDELTPRLPLSWETTLFRISQEALTNVAKHAHAKTVTVMLEELEDSIRLTVTDDGIGFDPQNHRAPGAKPSWGLINMRERAQAIGGQLSLETHMGKGTWITVEVQRPLGNQQG